LESRLRDALARATASGDDGTLEVLVGAHPCDDRDAMATLAVVHELSMAPIDTLGGVEVWQHHPAVADLRWRLEGRLVELLDEWADEHLPEPVPEEGPVATVRRLARFDAVPEVYRWLAEEASYDELVSFLALEGGPDGGFDDLVALAQVGLSGRPKMELARNYWDEMGRGTLAEVHTELHRRLSTALDMHGVAAVEAPLSALVRGVLGSYLALSRFRHPEALGAFGLIELQAGPRCRRVLRALERLDAPAEVVPFYAEHAEADPRHGKDWLDGAIAELAEQPRWAEGIVRGARWRAAAGTRFLQDALELVARPAADRLVGSGARAS